MKKPSRNKVCVYELPHKGAFRQRELTLFLQSLVVNLFSPPSRRSGTFLSHRRGPGKQTELFRGGQTRANDAN